MFKEDDKMYCDNCEELIKGGEENIIFIDASKGSGEFCSWDCVVEYATEFVEKDA